MLVRCYKENKQVIAFDKLNKSDGEWSIFFVVNNEILVEIYLIVFSELTCVNGDCSIWGQLWRVDGTWLTIMVLESLLLNSWVTVTLTFYYLVRMPRKKQKKSYVEEKNSKKKKKQVAVIYLEWVYQHGKRALNVFGVLVSKQFSEYRRRFYWWMWTLHPSMPKAQAHPKDYFPTIHHQQPISMDLPVQPCICGHRKTLEHHGNISKDNV